MKKILSILLVIILITVLVLLVGYYITLPLKTTKVIKNSEDSIKESALEISTTQYIKEIENKVLISKLNGVEIKSGTYKYDESDLKIDLDISGYKPDEGTFALDEIGNVIEAIFCIDNSTLTYKKEEGAKFISNNCNDLK